MKPTTLNCPTCQTIIEWADCYPERPFCSARCKNNDFIDWANEDRQISGTTNYDDVFSESDLSNY